MTRTTLSFNVAADVFLNTGEIAATLVKKGPTAYAHLFNAMAYEAKDEGIEAQDIIRALDKNARAFIRDLAAAVDLDTKCDALLQGLGAKQSGE